jgi:hypothetical protein
MRPEALASSGAMKWPREVAQHALLSCDVVDAACEREALQQVRVGGPQKALGLGGVWAITGDQEDAE